MKQVVITGCHRSGTSLLSNYLLEAGLFVGEDLLGGCVSNKGGHFEDLEPLAIHEEILKVNNESWRMVSHPDFSLSDKQKIKMQGFSVRRDGQHEVWGFKDPRTCLFLDEWNRVLSNPCYLFIYRHPLEVYFSLLRRHGAALIKDEGIEDYEKHKSFFTTEHLALRIWCLYNSCLLRFYKKNKEKCLFVSQDQMIEGYPIVKELNLRFGLGLREVSFGRVLRKDWINKDKSQRILVNNAELRSEVVSLLGELMAACGESVD